MATSKTKQEVKKAKAKADAKKPSLGGILTDKLNKTIKAVEDKKQTEKKPDTPVETKAPVTLEEFAKKRRNDVLTIRLATEDLHFLINHAKTQEPYTLRKNAGAASVAVDVVEKWIAAQGVKK